MKKFILYLIIFILLFLASLAFFLQTEYAKNLVISKVTSTIQSQTGWDVQLEELNLMFPLTLHVKGIYLTENAHPCIRIKDITVQFSLSDLWSQAYVFKRIHAAELFIFKTPESQKEGMNSLSASSFPSFLKPLLFPLKINLFQVDHLEISPTVISLDGLRKILSEAGPLSVKGTFSAIPRSRLASVEFSVYALKDPHSATTFFATYREDNHVITGQISLREPSKGIISSVLSFNNPYNTNSFIHFSNSENVWKGDFESKYSIQDSFCKEIVFAGSEGSVRGDFIYHADKFFKIPSFEFETKHVLLSGTVHLGGNGLLDGTVLQGNILDGNPSFFEGSLAAKATVSGTLSSLNAEVDFQSPLLKIEDISLKDLSGTMHLETNCEHQMLSRLQIQTVYNKQLVTASVNIDRLEDQYWNISNVNLISPHANLKGNFRLSPSLLVQGTFASYVNDLSQFEPFFQRQLSGEIEANGTLYSFLADKSALPVQKLDLKIETTGIKEEQFQFGPSTISLEFSNLWDTPSVNASFNVARLSSETWQFAQIHGNTYVNPSWTACPFDVSFQENSVIKAEAHAKGEWNLLAEGFRLHLNELNGFREEASIKLADPAVLSIDPDRIETTPVFLQIGQGVLYFSLDYTPDHFQLTTRLHKIPLEMLEQNTNPIPWTGLLNADLFFFGSSNVMGGQGHLSFQELKFKEERFAKLPLAEANMTVSLLESGVEGTAQVNRWMQTPINLNFKLPITISRDPFKLHIEMENPIEGHLAAKGEIAPLLQLFLTEITAIKDNTEIALDVSGTFSNIQMNGKAEIQNASFELIESGVILDQVTAQLNADGKSIVLSNFSAQDDKGGKINGRGTLELNTAKRFPYDIILELQKSQLVRLDYVKGVLSGMVNLKGNIEDSLLQGKIKVDSLKVQIPEQIPELTETIDITYVNIPENASAPIFYPKPMSNHLTRLNLLLDFASSAQIKGKDLNSSWSGTVALSGTNQAPIYTGELTIDHGVYDFNGKAFEINQGTISFAGDIEKKTTLYVIAHRDLGQITAEIIVKGAIKHPSIAFRSNPPLSQREILSWLLFNRGISDITPFQGEQLTQSITNLNQDQSQKGPDLLTKLRTKIGLDRIDISGDGNCDSNELSLQVGKYISKGVFVTLNKSFGAEANRLGIEANLGHEIKVEASISDGEESDGQILLKWKHDY